MVNVKTRTACGSYRWMHVPQDFDSLRTKIEWGLLAPCNQKSDGKQLQDEMVGSPHYKEKEVSLFQSNEIAEKFMKDGSVQVSARKRKAFIQM